MHKEELINACNSHVNEWMNACSFWIFIPCSETKSIEWHLNTVDKVNYTWSVDVGRPVFTPSPVQDSVLGPWENSKAVQKHASITRSGHIQSIWTPLLPFKTQTHIHSLSLSHPLSPSPTLFKLADLLKTKTKTATKNNNRNWSHRSICCSHG